MNRSSSAAALGYALLYSVAILLLACPQAFADVVVASHRVTVGVNIRERATSGSPIIGLLAPGDRLEYIGSVPRWYEVLLADGRHGFVSKAWTRVIADGVAGDYTMYAADVGTGLALLIQGQDFTAIYDGGSNDDLARGTGNRFVAFLQAAAPTLSRIDHVLLSHPHRDHVELLPDVLDKYEVHHVWDSGAVNPICGYRAFLRAIADGPTARYHSALFNFGTHTISFDSKRCYGTNLPAETIQLFHSSRIGTDPIPLGAGATMTFLHADGSKHSSFNENSLVVFTEVASQVEALFDGYDVLLSPVLRDPPFLLGWHDPQGDFDNILQRVLDVVAYTPLQNAAGMPALSVPLHWSAEGLPVGSQLSAWRDGERKLLELAYELEAARPWAGRRPPIHATCARSIDRDISSLTSRRPTGHGLVAPTFRSRASASRCGAPPPLAGRNSFSGPPGSDLNPFSRIPNPFLRTSAWDAAILRPRRDATATAGRVSNVATQM